MRIGLASDHVGFEHKERLKARFARQGHTAEDLSAEQAGEYRAMVGFENQAHFTTVFGNLVGMTPRQFQRSSERDSGGVLRPSLPAVECC